jgi:hypothetical protein
VVNERRWERMGWDSEERAPGEKGVERTFELRYAVKRDVRSLIDVGEPHRAIPSLGCKTSSESHQINEK